MKKPVRIYMPVPSVYVLTYNPKDLRSALVFDKAEITLQPWKDYYITGGVRAHIFEDDKELNTSIKDIFKDIFCFDTHCDVLTMHMYKEIEAAFNLR